MTPSEKINRFGNNRIETNQYKLTALDNNATFNLVSLLTGITYCQTLFNETPNEDDFLEISLICLRHIGNVHTQLKAFTGVTDNEGVLCLPYHAIAVEAVSSGNPDWISVDFRHQLSQLRPKGGFIAYKFLGDRIQTDFRNYQLNVLYKTLAMDENGMLLVTDKEAEACAYYWKFIDTKRKLYQGDKLAASVLTVITQDKNKAINNARLPDKFSQNWLDAYLNIAYSRDRKSYNINYKPINLA